MPAAFNSSPIVALAGGLAKESVEPEIKAEF